MPRLQGTIPADADTELTPLPPPMVEPRAKFLLRWHPAAWDIIGGRLLPRLGHLPVIEGVNQVGRGGSMAGAIAGAKERGWTVIPPSIRGPGTNYLRCYPTTSGPDTHWATEWEELHPGSQHIGSDTEGYVEFLVWLVEEGHIPPPAPYVVDRIRERLAKELDEAKNKSITVPSFRTEVTRLEAILANLEPPRPRTVEEVSTPTPDDSKGRRR